MFSFCSNSRCLWHIKILRCCQQPKIFVMYVFFIPARFLFSGFQTSWFVRTLQFPTNMILRLMVLNYVELWPQVNILSDRGNIFHVLFWSLWRLLFDITWNFIFMWNVFCYNCLVVNSFLFILAQLSIIVG